MTRATMLVTIVKISGHDRHNTQFDRIKDDIEQMKGFHAGTVSIATSPSPATLLLPPVLKRFQIEFPTIQIRIRESVYPDTLKLLREGLVDIAVGAQPPLDKGSASEFDVETLYDNNLVVTCRKNHPKAKVNSLKELLDCNWLLHGPIEGPGYLHAPVFRANGLALPKAMIMSDSFISTIGLLENSDTLCLLPQRLIQHLSQHGRLIALNLKEPMPNWGVSLITRSSTPLTPITHKMVQMFRRTPPIN
jgi:DNA-binding transcriptional LysR family regulator